MTLYNQLKILVIIGHYCCDFKWFYLFMITTKNKAFCYIFLTMMTRGSDIFRMSSRIFLEIDNLTTSNILTESDFLNS